MRKKFTMLLALMFLCMGAMNADDVTKFYKLGERKTTLSSDDKVLFYNTAQVTAVNEETGTVSVVEDRTGFLVDNGSALGHRKTKPANTSLFLDDDAAIFTIETVEDLSTCYKLAVKGGNGYVGIAGVTNNSEVRDLYAFKWQDAPAAKRAGVGSENADGQTVVNADISEDDNVWVIANAATEAEITTTWNGNANSFATWETAHPYAIYSVVEAETADLESYLSAAKNAAIKEFQNGLGRLSIFDVDFEEQIDGVVLENNDLEAALNAIEDIVLAAKKSLNGKSVVFDNTHTDARADLSITAMSGNVYGTASTGDETIWTIKSQEDGSFKLYSFVANKYLNNPGTAALTDEATAACYNFIVTAENTAALVTTSNQMLHQAAYWTPKYTLLSWYDINDPASLWTITEKEIKTKITREQYDLAAAAKASLPYAIQEAYGLVTDAANYYSNWLSTAEGSYAALLDNASDTYFHSAYTDEAKAEGAETHYIQADLGEGKSVDEFYFYMAPRTQNSNNRPSNVIVSGSNDNSVYTTIAEITTTLDWTTTPYFSAKLGTDGTNYRYIRLTVNSTNDDTKFFTLSELYFFPATDDVTSFIESYNSFAAASITETAMNDAATALINAETTLALANIKKEIVAILEANEGNHAETPALGQYTTEAYNALNTAYTAGDATQESLEAAIAAFNASLNSPVYFITSKHDGYAAGSAIYYDGAWKWKAANKFDRQMWMTIPAYTQENVPVVEAYDVNGTSYEICDFLTGTVMRGKSVQIVEIADWDGVYNLQYNAVATSTDAAQHAKDNGQLVNWTAATTSDAKASAWGVEYIGNTYDLKNLTDEQLTALAALHAAHDAKAYIADAELGNGLGQYKGDKDAIVTVLNDGKAILDKTFKEQAELTVDAINAATTAINNAEDLVINLPEEGKFYRIKGANAAATLKGYYITGNTNADGGRIALQAEADADAATVFYYADGKLLSYGSGLYIGLSSSHWTFATVDGSKPASTIVFAASPNKAGAYNIKSADKYLHYKEYGSAVELDRCGSGSEAADSWIIEEVTTLPVAVSAAGYATLYAPVALKIPDGVIAYTSTLNGEYLKLHELEGTIPAGTGVILKAEANTYDFVVAEDVAAVENNAFTGSFAKSVKNPNMKVYTLQMPANNVVGFYLFKGQNSEGATTYINGFRAWVELESGSQVQALRIARNGETSIENMESIIHGGEQTVVYDLLGRRVEKMEKGIYIVNGKKIIK